MIRECILVGGIIYIAITALQVIDRPTIIGEGTVAAFALFLATAFYLTGHEHRLHTTEMVALWAVVLLFAVYGIMKFGGVL